MIISLIVAMDEKRGIGKGKQLPWHLPSDLKRFKQLTMGHHIIMGRKTFETIGRTLPGRVMIVLSHQDNYAPNGATVAHSLRQALDIARSAHENECFIIGGGDVFQESFILADKIYLTRVHAATDADTWFPEIDPNQWSIISSEETATENNHDVFSTDFTILQRKK